MFVFANKGNRHRLIYAGLVYPSSAGGGTLVTISAAVGLVSQGYGRGLVSVGHVRGFTR